ncbi:hypothetical protein [Neptuniibacter sp. QD37_11]|uniref:hypothetical protein n=1 Tax=Neptuniibacter sp. QD37_11 TaxID=3398209 RepID=UPI0039F50264
MELKKYAPIVIHPSITALLATAVLTSSEPISNLSYGVILVLALALLVAILSKSKKQEQDAKDGVVNNPFIPALIIAQVGIMFSLGWFFTGIAYGLLYATYYLKEKEEAGSEDEKIVNPPPASTKD